MPMQAVDGGYLHHDIQGPASAPALVLINSLATDFRLWDRLLPLIQGEWRIVRSDKRGHGLSSPATDGWTIDRHAADIETLLDAHGIGQAVLMGVSVGGLISQAIYARAPQKVRALILSDTGSKIGNDEIWFPRITAVRENGIASIVAPTMERWFPAAFRDDHPDQLALWQAMVGNQTDDGFIATADAIRRADYTESSAKIAVPTQVIYGSEDGGTPPALNQALAALIPGAALAEIPGAGHLPMADKPVEMAAIVNGFLAGLA